MTNTSNIVGSGAGHDTDFYAGTVISGGNSVFGGDTLNLNMPALGLANGVKWDLNGYYQTFHTIYGAGITTATIDLNGGTLRIGGDYGTGVWAGILTDSKNTGVFDMNMVVTNTGANNGTFSIASVTNTVGQFVMASGNLTGSGSMTAGTVSLQNGTMGVALVGSGAMTKSTTGTVYLPVANRFSGSTPCRSATAF